MSAIGQPVLFKAFAVTLARLSPSLVLAAEKMVLAATVYGVGSLLAAKSIERRNRVNQFSGSVLSYL